MGSRSGQHGFSLVVLAIWMIVLGITAAAVLALRPNRSDRLRTDKTITTIGDAENDVLAFIVTHSRLPAPDTDHSPDGTENPGGDSGALPYRSMGLPTSLLDEAGIPLRYTPYRHATVDLTDPDNFYKPVLPDLSGLDALRPKFTDPVDTQDFIQQIDLCTDEATASPVNLLDFCTALAMAVASAPTADSVNVPPGHTNVAYAVLSGGLEDADGDRADQSLDGRNDTGDVSYEDPARGRSAGYDDIVRAVRFPTLQRQLSCKALIDSVNTLATQAQAAESVMESALSSYSSAQTQVIMSEVQALMDIIAVAQTVQAGIGIAADIGESAGGCASLILSAECCPALGGNIAAGVVYAVTAAVQVDGLATNIEALDDAIKNRNLFRDKIVPAVNAHLCSAIAETTGADNRGGLAPLPQP